MWCPQTPRSFLVLILLVQVSNAILMNQTIDDGLGDSLTGLKVQYSPSPNDGVPVWKSQDTCNHCAITPDRTVTYNNTWTSATSSGSSLENVTATFRFHGTAVYIYFVIPNVPVSTGVESTVDCDFLVDGRLAGSYTHAPDGTYKFQYNTLVYASIGLSSASHTFVIQAKRNSFVIFDYAQYTTDVPAPSGASLVQSELPKPSSTSSASSTSSITSTGSPSTNNTTTTLTPAGIIAVAVSSGILGIALVVLGVILCHRRTRGNINHNGTFENIVGLFAKANSGHISPFTLSAGNRHYPAVEMGHGYITPREQAMYQNRSSNPCPEIAETSVGRWRGWRWIFGGWGHRDSSRGLTAGGPTRALIRSRSSCILE